MGKNVVQTGSSIYLESLGVVVISHKEPKQKKIDVFVIEMNELEKQPDPHKANTLKRFSFPVEETTIDDAMDRVVEIVKAEKGE
jgi:hypothetical protein